MNRYIKPWVRKQVNLFDVILLHVVIIKYARNNKWLMFKRTIFDSRMKAWGEKKLFSEWTPSGKIEDPTLFCKSNFSWTQAGGWVENKFLDSSKEAWGEMWESMWYQWQDLGTKLTSGKQDVVWCFGEKNFWLAIKRESNLKDFSYKSNWCQQLEREFCV